MNILITGCRSNLGYSYAKSLAKVGHIVYAGVKTKNEMITLEEKINNDKVIMFPIILDLTLKDSFDIIDKIDFDAIILQAGVGEGGSILELSKERLVKNIDINIVANFLLIQKYLRYCYYNKKRGKIFITSSLAAFLPLPYLASYTSSKIYLYHLASTLRLEALYQGLDVSISLILPGAYKTGFNEVMIDNKEADNYIMMKKALNMTKIQKIFFSILESMKIDEIGKVLVREIKKNKPKFIISRPYSQKIITKIFIIIKTIVEC